MAGPLGLDPTPHGLQAAVGERDHVECVRLPMAERGGQGCAIETALSGRISRPYARDGQRTAALRFGDRRVMARAGASGVMVHVVSGFANKSLRSLVAGLSARTARPAR